MFPSEKSDSEGAFALLMTLIEHKTKVGVTPGSTLTRVTLARPSMRSRRL